MDSVTLIAICFSTSIVICVVICVLFVLAKMFSMKINIFYMRDILIKDTILEKTLDKILRLICEEENIGVYYIDNKTINKNNEPNETICGQYLYTKCGEHQIKMNSCLNDIKEMESDYGETYSVLMKSIGKTTKYSKRDFTLPRIEINSDSIKKYGVLSTYATFIHELGHHFLIKKQDINHTEDDANNEAWKIILERLPKIYHTIFNFDFSSRIKDLPEPKKNFQYYKTYFELILMRKHYKLCAKTVTKSN